MEIYFLILEFHYIADKVYIRTPYRKAFDVLPSSRSQWFFNHNHGHSSMECLEITIRRGFSRCIHKMEMFVLYLWNSYRIRNNRTNVNINHRQRIIKIQYRITQTPFSLKYSNEG